MATILKFVVPPRRARAEATSRTGAERLCEIVIFPGVRYERWSDEAGKPAPKPKRGRKRRARAR